MSSLIFIRDFLINTFHEKRTQGLSFLKTAAQKVSLLVGIGGVSFLTQPWRFPAKSRDTKKGVHPNELMSCHWEKMENVLEIFFSSALQKQYFLTEDIPTNKDPMNGSSLLLPPFPFLLCSPATKVQVSGVEKMSSNVSSFLKKKKTVNNYSHCKKIFLPPTCWGKPTNLKTILTVLLSI